MFALNLFLFLVGLYASLVIGWLVFPKVLYSQKVQPLDFNHALHVEATGDCESCHYFRDDGSFSGIPKLDNCAQCHEEMLGDDPEEAKLVEEHISRGREIPWLVHARQPDCVFFSHAAHVKKAEMECEICHGPVGESEHSRVYERNRLTGYSRDIWGKNLAGIKKNSWDRMKMDDCAECHARMKEGAKEACFVCHK